MSHQTKTVAAITKTTEIEQRELRTEQLGELRVRGVADEIGWSPAGRCSRPGVRTIHVTR